MVAKAKAPSPYQTFDRASHAIKYAHEWAPQQRFEASMRKETNSPPAAIYRRSTTGKSRRQAAGFIYTIASAWEPMPEKAGTLVAIVSAAGMEQLCGPWLDEEKAFVEALKG